MMQKAQDKPVLRIDKFTPKRFMEYIAIHANQFAGKALGRAEYGRKRSVFSFFVKLHNRRGHLQEFKDELACLWKGFPAEENKTENPGISVTNLAMRIKTVIVTAMSMMPMKMTMMISKRGKIPCRPSFIERFASG